MQKNIPAMLPLNANCLTLHTLRTIQHLYTNPWPSSQTPANNRRASTSPSQSSQCRAPILLATCRTIHLVRDKCWFVELFLLGEPAISTMSRSKEDGHVCWSSSLVCNIPGMIEQMERFEPPVKCSGDLDINLADLLGRLNVVRESVFLRPPPMTYKDPALTILIKGLGYPAPENP